MSLRPTRLLAPEEITVAVERLGRAISGDHPGGVDLVGVLKGGAFLMADLLRAVSVECRVDFLALSPYGGEGARVRILKDLDADVTGRDVVLVEGVVDTGLSAAYLLGLLRERGARTVSLCALLDRPARRVVPLAPTYRGFEAPETYLVGYGLDLRERYRNLPGIYALADLSAPSSHDRPEVDDPPEARYDAALYGAREGGAAGR